MRAAPVASIASLTLLAATLVFDAGCPPRGPVAPPTATATATATQTTPAQANTSPAASAIPFTFTGPRAVSVVQGPSEVTQSSLVRWSPDGRLFAVMDRRSVELRDGETGALRAIARGAATGIAWSTRGDALALLLQRGLVLWDLRRNAARLLDANDTLPDHLRCQTGDACAHFSPDDARLLVPADNGLLLWDLRAGRVITALRGHDPVWSADGALVAVIPGPDASTLTLHDGHSGARRTGPLRLPDDLGAIGALAFAPTGHTLAVGGSRLALIDADSGRLLRASPPLADTAATLTFSPSGKALAVGVASYEGALSLWALDEKAPQPIAVGTLPGPLRASFAASADRLAAVHDRGGASFAFAVADANTRALTTAPMRSFVLGALRPDLRAALLMQYTNDDLQLTVLGERAPRFSLPQARERTGWCWSTGPTPRLALDDAVIDLRRGTLVGDRPTSCADGRARTASDASGDGKIFSQRSPDGRLAVGTERWNERLEAEPCLVDVATGRCAVALDFAPLRPGLETWRWSPDGRALVHVDGVMNEVATVFATDSGAVRARVPLGQHLDAAFLDDRVLALFGPNGLRLHSLTDGAELELVIVTPLLAPRTSRARHLLVVRDDGSVDGDEGALARVLVRDGDDLTRAALRPLAGPADPRHRPGLYEAFLAGR